MKIKDLSLIRLHNLEHLQFHTSFRDLILVFTFFALKIEALFNNYLMLYKNESDALELVRKNLLTDDLEIADNERDSVFHGLCDAVKSAHNHFNAEFRAAAKRIQVVLDSYGNLAIKPYDAETGGITKLIQDLTGKYAADITMLGLNEWVIQLNAKNIAFEDLKNNRYSAEAAKTMLHMKQERVKLDAAYRTIVNQINALILVEGETDYANFVNELNKRIEGYDNTVSIRRGKSQKSTDNTTATK